MRIDRRLLGWGAFLIIAGSIPLAVRAGAISADALSDWPSLWPLLLIGGGLTLLLRRTPLHMVGGIVSVLTAGVMVGGLLAAGFHGFSSFGACDSRSAGSAFPEQSGSFGDRAEIEVEFNCGDLHIASQDGDAWALSGTGPSGHQPDVRRGSDSLRIEPARGRFEFTAPASTWDLTLPRDPSLTVSVTLNAGDGTADLSGATVGAFDVTVNAGSFTADLGSAAKVASATATVNAGSAAVALPATASSAGMTVNAGSLKLCVPPDAGLRISWGGALASNNFEALGLTEVDDGHWERAGVSAQLIDVNVTANAGSFTLVIGGSCHA